MFKGDGKMSEQALDYRMQGVAMMGTSNYAKAKAFFQKGLEIEPSAELFMDLGNAHASLEEYNEAIQAFSKALLLQPKNGEILFSIGSVYLLQERLTKCIEYYNKAEEAGYTTARLYMNMAAIYKALGDTQMELRCYTKAIDKNPMFGEFYVKKVMIFIQNQRYAEALETLDDMRKIFPDAFEGYDLAARIYMGQGKQKEALEIINEGIKKFENDVNLRISKINILLAMNLIEDAEKVVAELKNNIYASQFEKAIILQEVTIASAKDDPETMYSLLTKAVSLEEAGTCDENTRYMLMMTAVLVKKYETAMEMAKVLVEQKSKSEFVVSAIYHIGEIANELGKTEEAVEYFKAATKKLRQISMSSRTHYECYLYRTLAHMKIKEYDKALEMAEYIVDLQPERADGYMIYADIYRDMGDIDKSDKYFRMAQEKNPALKKRDE